MHDQQADQDDALFRKVSRRLLPFLMISYAVAYLDRVNVGLAKLQMSHDLGLSDAAYGVGAGLFFVGYFLFEVPSNIMLHRIGARIWIARIMISWGLASAACAFIQGSTSFYAVRVLLGITEAGFFPGVILYLTYWYPAARRGRIIATFMTAIPIAGLVGTPLSGFLMSSMDGLLGWAGWRWMLLVEALPPLLLGVAVPFVLASRVEDAKWLTGAERQRIRTLLEQDTAGATAPTHGRLRDCLRDPAVLRFSAIYFCVVMAQYGITFWLPTLIAGAELAPAWLIGLYAALPYGCAVAAMVWTGNHSDRTGERRWHLIVPMLLGGAALVIAPMVHVSMLVAVLVLCVGAAGVLTATPLFWNLPTTVLRGTSAVIGIAAINSVGNIAGFMSPIVVGWTTDRGGSIAYGMWLLVGVLVIGALLVPRIRRGAPKQDAFA